jgi:hypothetical protein
MSQAATYNGLFKKVYGKFNNLRVPGMKLLDYIPFEGAASDGESYVEGMALTDESGHTWTGSGLALADINPANAGVVEQAEYKSYEYLLTSVIPWKVMSRTQGNEKAFKSATKYLVSNNLESHARTLQDAVIYGQADGLFGHTSYTSATFRGVSLTNGTGTINGIAFTNGVNAASSAVLFNLGEFASGLFVGREGTVFVEIERSSGNVVFEGRLKSVNVEYGYVTFESGSPVAASSLTSHYWGIKGMEDTTKLMPGIIKIISTQSGQLFGIETSKYSRYRGIVVDGGGPNSGVKLTFGRILDGIAYAANKGLGTPTQVEQMVFMNNLAWANVLDDQMAYRRFDNSYKITNLDVGANMITFHSQIGITKLVPCAFMKEGQALGLCKPLSAAGQGENVPNRHWYRGGSSEMSFQVPGADGQLIKLLDNQTGYKYTSRSDQFVACRVPGYQIFWKGYNWESAT